MRCMHTRCQHALARCTVSTAQHSMHVSLPAGLACTLSRQTIAAMRPQHEVHTSTDLSRQGITHCSRQLHQSCDHSGKAVEVPDMHWSSGKLCLSAQSHFNSCSHQHSGNPANSCFASTNAAADRQAAALSAPTLGAVTARPKSWGRMTLCVMLLKQGCLYCTCG